MPEEVRSAVEAFELPAGCRRETVPPHSVHRSIIYDYGVKCSRVDAVDTKSEGYIWFCMASHACRVKSIHGQGIAIKGYSQTSVILSDMCTGPFPTVRTIFATFMVLCLLDLSSADEVMITHLVSWHHLLPLQFCTRPQ